MSAEETTSASSVGTAPAPTPDEARGEAPGRGRLAGRRILIVGGGQQTHGLDNPPIGNGRAMSILFAREGAAVAIADINRDAAEGSAGLARAEPGADVTVLTGDAADDDDVAAMLAGAADALDGLDGLVLNVGIGAGLLLRGTSAEDWDRVMAVNLRSQFLGCKHAIEAMDEGGAIVLLGSIAAHEVMPMPAYAASKAGSESLCRQAAIEGAPSIRVNLLHPGLIDTSIGRLASQISPRRDQVKIPLGRQGNAWEIAYAALYLLSAESSYVTGQTLIVDGGLSVAARA